MKKGNATLVFIALIAFTVIAWIGTVKGQISNVAAYEEYLDKAKSFEQKEIYVDALENYQKALELNQGEYEIVLKIAEMYFNIGEINDFIATCDKAIGIDAENPIPYIKKADYYISKTQYSEAIKVIKDAERVTKDNEEINKLKEELSFKYIDKYVSYTSVLDWHVQNKVNYVVVEDNGKWGITAKDGKREMKFKFEYIGAYDIEAEVLPCCCEGEYYYVDLLGNKKLVGDNSYQYLGSFGCGLAPAQRKNKYGYIDEEFNERNFEYEYAGAFANNLAAVKKSGKWALINNELEKVTGFEYDDILVDSYGFCSMYDVIIARKGNEYILLNHEGEKVSNEVFEGAALPAANNSYIAVKKDGKWGFVDTEGKMVIEPKYANAKSFSMGLAPVKIDEKWGYIDEKGKLVIAAKYTNAGTFSSDGSAPVESSSVWNFIVLCEYDE